MKSLKFYCHLILLVCLLHVGYLPAQIHSIASGNWDSPTTWDCNCVPSNANTVTVNAGHLVEVVTNSNTAYSVAIAQTGSLQVHGAGTLTIFDTLYNAGYLYLMGGTLNVMDYGSGEDNGYEVAPSGFTYLNSGILNIGQIANMGGNAWLRNKGYLSMMGGFIFVMGRFSAEQGSTLLQTGGTMVIDGNMENNPDVYSVGAYKPLLYIHGDNANCSDGKIIIRDPHHKDVALGTETVVIEGDNKNAFSNLHALELGDGTAGAEGNDNGFIIENHVGTGRCPLQHLYIKSNHIQAGRYVNPGYQGGLHLKGNLHISENSELRHIWSTSPEFAVDGDIWVETGSTFTCMRTLTLGTIGYPSNVNAAQVYGGGTFRNDFPNYNVTGHLGALHISKNTQSYVLMNFTNNLKVTDSLHFQSGVLQILDSLTLGSALFGELGYLHHQQGHLIPQAGKMGKLIRWFGTQNYALQDGIFPLGPDVNTYRPCFVGCNPTQAGYLSAKFNPDNQMSELVPGNVRCPSPYTDAGVYVNGYAAYNWEIIPDASFMGSNLSLRIQGGNLLLTNLAQIRMYHPLGISGTSADGTGTLSAPQANRTGLNQTTMNGYFHIGGNQDNLPVNIRSVQSGNWHDPATWQYNIIPSLTSGYGAIISSGHTVQQTAFANPLRLISEQNSTLHLSTTFNSINNSRIAGTVNLGNGNFNTLSLARDTALYIAPTGTLNLQQDNSTFTSFYANVTNPDSYVAIRGSLNIGKGNFNIYGAISFDGNSHFNMGRDTRMTINGRGPNPLYETSRDLLTFNTTGNITAQSAKIYFPDPPKNPNQATVKIIRNNASNFDLTPTTIYLGLGSTIYNASGDANTGFMLETKAGTLNMPLGSVVAAGGTGMGRFARNGVNGVNIGGNLTVQGSSAFHLTASSDENYIGGDINLNNSMLYTMAQLILGGTAQHPVNRVQSVSLTSSNIQNAITGSDANFNKLKITNQRLVSLLNPMTVKERLNLDDGILEVRSLFLELGISTSHVGELVVNKGKILALFNNAASFGRWFNTTTINLGDTEGLFPLTDGYDTKFAYVGGTASAGGMVTMSYHTTNNTYTALTPYTDAGLTVERAYPNQWVAGVLPGYSNPNMSLRFIEGGQIFVGNINDLRVNNTGTLLGNHAGAAWVNNSPSADRTNIPSSMLAGKGFRLAGANSNINGTLFSVSNGDWDNPATWNCNCIPASGNDVVIYHQVSINAAGNKPHKVRTLSIFNNCNLQLNADSLQVQALQIDYFNAHLTLNGGYFHCLAPSTTTTGTAIFGQLHLQSGYFKWNSLVGWHSNILGFVNGSFLEMSGGSMEIDGAMALEADNKTLMSGGNCLIKWNNHNQQPSAPPYALRVVGSADDATFPKHFTGGTIQLPNAKNDNGMQPLVSFHQNFYNNSISFAADHTLILGSDMPADTLGNSGYGFFVAPQAGTYTVPLGSVTVNGKGLDKRFAYFQANTCLKGTLSIESNSSVDFKNQSGKLYVAGDFVNEGYFFHYSTMGLVLGGWSGYAATQPQMYGGNGYISHNQGSLSTYPQFIWKLEVDNISTTGLTFNKSATTLLFYMINGDINMGAHTLTCGLSTSFWGAAFISGTGAIIGKYRKWVNNSASTYLFPVGMPNQRQNATLTFTSAPMNGGTITAEFRQGMPVAGSGLPLQEGTINVDVVSPTGYWAMEADANLAAGVGTYDLSLNAKNFANVSDYTSLVMIKRSNDNGPWTLEGMHQQTSGTNSNCLLQRTGLTSFSQFAIGSDANINAFPVEWLEFTATPDGAQKLVLLKWTTTREVNSSHFEVERSQDGIVFEKIGEEKSIGNSTVATTYPAKDLSPLPGKSYYRIKQIDLNGAESYSDIRAVRLSGTQELGFSLYPNPSRGQISIAVEASNLDTEMSSCVVTDVQGKILFHERLSQTNFDGQKLRIDLRNQVSQGIYFVSLKTPEGEISEKLIIVE